jgi:hypothetical protein
VDFPETWTFSVTVNRLVDGSLVKLTQVSATFPVSDAVVLEGLAGLQYAIEGSPFDVLLLQAHVVAATGWLVAVTVVAFLAVPRLRRMLSPWTLYRLDLRLYAVNGLMWVLFGSVLVTGTFLLGTQSAYGMPWSKAAWDSVIKLPYASIYFTALFVKVGVFLAMAAASAVLSVEAARQGRIAGGAAEFDASDDEFWRHLQFYDAMRDTGERVAQRRPDAGGVRATTAVATSRLKSKILTRGAGLRTLWWCVFVVVAGVGAIAACVTVLKYTHELFEMILAAQAIAEAE